MLIAQVVPGQVARALFVALASHVPGWPAGVGARPATAASIQKTVRRAASGDRRARSDQPRENDSLSWIRRDALKWPHAATLGEHEPESGPVGGVR